MGSTPSLQPLVGFRGETSWLSALIALHLQNLWRASALGDRERMRSPGFPAQPLLEDYAAVLARNDILFDARLIAAEYKARLLWGDRPARSEYRVRFPNLGGDLSAELERVESEVLVEMPTATMVRDSSVKHIVNADPDPLPAASHRAPTSRPELPRIGKFQTIQLLGRGAFGEVWLAEHPQLQRKVAIKVPRSDRRFSDTELDDFVREGQRLAALQHIPGIVRVFDADEHNGVPYIVSDFIAGESLDRRLGREPLPHMATAKVISALAQSLHQAHLAGFTHRDVKPSNILLDEHDRPHLADFGLSVAEHEQLRERPATLGTFAYMSPEQARGESHLVDGRTDIYSLGGVFYLMLTRRLLFVADDSDGYVRQILGKEPRPPRMIDDQIPEELERICLKCLRKSPVDRYSTAGDLSRDLNKALAGSRPPIPRRSLSIAGGSVLLVIAILSWRLTRPTTSPATSRGDPLGAAASSGRTAATSPSPATAGVVPNAIFAETMSPSNFFQVSEFGQRLQVVSNDLYLVQLGTIGREDAVIEIGVEVSDLKSNEGAAGVFIGFRDRPTDSHREFQLLRLQQRADGQVSARRSRNYFDPGTPYWRSSEDFGESIVDQKLRVDTLKLRISDGHLTEVHWNGVRVEHFPDSGDDAASGREVVGAFGVYANQCVAEFTQFTVDGNPQTVTKSP